MSDYEFEMDLDLDTDFLYREEEEPEVEEDPTPSLPADQLQPLVCGEGQLFTDSQLVQFVDEPSPDPASSPAPRSAEVELALQPVHIESWVEDVEEQEADLLKSQDVEEQQEQGDHQDLLQSLVETSDLEVSRDGVEQVPLQSEPNVQDLVLEAQRRASLQATLDCLSGRGSRPQPQNSRRLGCVGNALLQDWYQPERNSV